MVSLDLSGPIVSVASLPVPVCLSGVIFGASLVLIGVGWHIRRKLRARPPILDLRLDQQITRPVKKPARNGRGKKHTMPKGKSKKR